MIILLALMWLLNLVISYMNARTCGLVWAETKAVGGWSRLMTWAGAVMSACGFTWCYLVVLAGGAYAFEWLTPHQFKIAMEMGYLLIIPGVLVSGFLIMVDSWAQAFRSRGWMDYGLAVYNTAANLSNTYDAITSFGPALKDVMGAFEGDSDDDDDGKGALLLLLLVVLAAAAGILTTAAIIKSYAGTVRIARRPI